MGCATTSQSTGGVVRVYDEPIVTTEPATEPSLAEDPAGFTEDPVFADNPGLLDDTIDGDLGAESTSDHRQALDQAIAWAREGVEHDRAGNPQAALAALEDARIALIEADLPESMQEAGLGVLDCVLGDDIGGVDLEALVAELERDLTPVAPELEQRRYVEKEARRILAQFGASSPSDAYMETFIDQVENYIDYYQGRHREFFERSFVRKYKYWPVIRSIFEAKGIPIEQGYMALVESGFNPRARSHANALGLWQFIPATGKRYGLRQRADFYDVTRATEAASEYLLDLIGIFGSRSFLLAT
ncbi:MAG: transglycosylase SLT domain-containing protein, partial [Acidobacteriota bacterium]